MGVHVAASRGGLGGHADDPPVFDDVLALGDVAHGDLMAERDGVDEPYRRDGLALEGDGADLGADRQVCDGHADVVVGFVNQDSVCHAVLLIEWGGSHENDRRSIIITKPGRTKGFLQID
jgi:hypothetical protein